MVLLVLEALVVCRVRRIGELLDGRAREDPVEEIRERARRIRVVDRLGVDVVLRALSEPDGNRVLRRDAAEPTVLLVLGRARLARSLLAVRKARRGSRAARDNALHDLDGRMGDLGRDDALPDRIGVVDDHVALSIEDLLDALRLVMRSAVCERRVSLRHLKRRHRRDAEGQARNSRQVGVDPETARHVDDLVDADGEDKARERRVRGNRKRLGDGAHAVVVMPEVGHLRGTRHLHRRPRVDDGLRIDALLDRRGKREGLERRAGHAPASALAGGHVALSVVVVGVVAADHGFDVTVIGVYGDERDLELLTRLVDLVARRNLSRLLRGRIDGRVDGQPAFPNVGRRVLVPTFGVGQLIAHVAGEVRVFQDAGRRGLGRIENDGLRFRGVSLLLAHHSVGDHAIENEVAAIEAVLLVVDRIVVGGRLGNADERRRLDERQIARVL